MKPHRFCFLLSIFLIVSCQTRQQDRSEGVNDKPIRILALKHARGFTVDYYDDYKLVIVRDWKDTTRILARYVLGKKGVSHGDALPVVMPADKVICVSTTQIAEMERLGLADKIPGVTGAALIYSNRIQQRIKDGAIANLGNEEMDFEKLVSLNPSFVTTSGNYDGGDKLNFKLESLNIRSVLNLDYMEQDPLARAEWLKYVAVFFDKEELADSLFNETEEKYLALKKLASGVQHQPKVFCNLPFKEIWYMPCGENYMARLFADAGGDFIWKETKATNGLNLNLDYEAVYNKAAEADIWLNTGFAQSLKEIKDADRKNTFFKAWKTGRVYNNNLRNTPAGGFDFWESGMLNPDIILADLIAIFHPELTPAHKLYYYQQLN